MFIGLISGAALAGSTPPLLRSLVWIAPGAELEALSVQPQSCLTGNADDIAVRSGRALFNTPLLLGGQAAKAGLTCNSCHVSGRDNPHFFLRPLSSETGTADVTSSFFSMSRGNGRFDPIVIPDLAATGKISRDPQTGALDRFVRNLIVEEFSGAEPSKATLAALASYIRALRRCEGERINGPNTLRRLDDQLAIIFDAVEGAAHMAKAGEVSSARLLIGAARYQLGLIDERYALPDLKTERKALLEASLALQRVSDQSEMMTDISPALAKWKAGFMRITLPLLRRTEARTLYQADILKNKLNQR